MQICARLCTQTCTVTFFPLPEVRMFFCFFFWREHSRAVRARRTCTAAHTKPDGGRSSLAAPLMCRSSKRVVVARRAQVCRTVKDSPPSIWTRVNICFSLSCRVQHCHSGVFACREVLGGWVGGTPHRLMFGCCSCAAQSPHGRLDSLFVRVCEIMQRTFAKD